MSETNDITTEEAGAGRSADETQHVDPQADRAQADDGLSDEAQASAPQGDAPSEAAAQESVTVDEVGASDSDRQPVGQGADEQAPDAGADPEDEQAPDAGADPEDEQAPDAGADPEESAVEAAPAKRRASRSRRATRPTSAPEHDVPERDAAQRLDVLAELGSSGPERAPATRSASSGDATAALGSIVFESPTRRASAPAAAPVTRDLGAEAGEAQQRPADDLGDAGDQRRAADQGDATDQDNSADQGDAAAEADGGPRLPVTALLFQAPDLTSAASRSRRAQAPAGPPVPPAFGFEQGEQAAADDEAPRAPQRRRRPSAPKPETSGDQLEASSQDSAEESTDEEPTDLESTDEDSTGDESGGNASAGQRRRRRRGGRGRRNRSGAGGEGSANDDDEDEDDDESASDSGDADDEAGEQDDSRERDTDSGRAKQGGQGRGNRRRQGRGRGQRDQSAGSSSDDEAGDEGADAEAGSNGENDGEGAGDESGSSSSRRRRRRRRGSRSEGGESSSAPDSRNDEVTALKGSTRLEAKRQRRREGRDAGRRRTVVTEAEFLARRESVDRSMVVRERDGRTQIAVLEDNVLVEHFVARRTQTSMVGNVYLGRVQNVLPSMEAAFIDLGKGRNAVLYAGEVNWDAAGMEGQPRRIEQALSSGDPVMVQVTKDPIGHKGARLTSQITLAGRYLVLVPSGGMTGISRKLPDTERARLKKLLREIVPDGSGVIVRTAAEGASEEELRLDVARLQVQWAEIERKAKNAPAPSLLQGEPDLAIRVVRDVFNEDFGSVTISGDEAWDAIAGYIESIAPDLAPRLHRWTSTEDVFHAHRIDEQLTKALDRKVWLPSGGSLVIDRTEAMTVVDVNTGKFVGAGGTLEETVTRNNLEAAEEIVRQLRLRDIGGIIVIDFIDMVLESNRDLVLRRLVECLGRDRTRHQVAEVTSLGLVQMTRKRVGMGLLEAFTEPCEACNGRGHHVRSEPVEKATRPAESAPEESGRSGSRRRGKRGGDGSAGAASSGGGRQAASAPAADESSREAVKAKLATIAAAAAHAHDEHGAPTDPEHADVAAGAEANEVLEIDGPGSDDAEAAAQDSPADVSEAGEAGAVETGQLASGDQDGAEQADAELAGAEQADGELAGGEQADGEQADGEQAGGEDQADQDRADDIQRPAEEGDGEEADGAQVPEDHAEGAQAPEDHAGEEQADTDENDAERAPAESAQHEFASGHPHS